MVVMFLDVPFKLFSSCAFISLGQWVSFLTCLFLCSSLDLRRTFGNMFWGPNRLRALLKSENKHLHKISV